MRANAPAALAKTEISAWLSFYSPGVHKICCRMSFCCSSGARKKGNDLCHSFLFGYIGWNYC